MKLCTECNEQERVGYLYCADCKITVFKRKNAEGRKLRRAGAKKLCTECGIVETGTKYCKSCCKFVAARKHLERRKGYRMSKKAADELRAKAKAKIKKRPAIAEKWLVRGPITNSNRTCTITGGAEC